MTRLQIAVAMLSAGASRTKRDISGALDAADELLRQSAGRDWLDRQSDEKKNAAHRAKAAAQRAAEIAEAK